MNLKRNRGKAINFEVSTPSIKNLPALIRDAADWTRRPAVNDIRLNVIELPSSARLKHGPIPA